MASSCIFDYDVGLMSRRRRFGDRPLSLPPSEVSNDFIKSSFDNRIKSFPLVIGANGGPGFIRRARQIDARLGDAEQLSESEIASRRNAESKGCFF